MISLISGIVLLSILSKTVSLVGDKYISEAVWNYWLIFFPSQDMREMRFLQKRATDLYTARDNISAKDDFNKWAKIDREYNGVRKKMVSLANTLDSRKTYFTRFISMVISMTLFSLRLFIRTYYRRSPVVWLPRGFFPYPVLWLLSIFSSPIGSLSVTAWLFIVDSALSTLLLVPKDMYKMYIARSTLRNSHESQ